MKRHNNKQRSITAVLMAVLFAVLFLGGCGSSIEPTRFVNPDFDFGFVERVAVLPLENMTNDRQAGERATRLLITELLASGAVDVVEPGEVRAVMEKISGLRRSPTTEETIEIGKALGVQGVLAGMVSQSEVVRTGTVQVPVVTLDVHMLETETGRSVWAATHTEKGSGAAAKFLGTGAEPISETTRRCVRVVVETLVK